MTVDATRAPSSLTLTHIGGETSFVDTFLYRICEDRLELVFNASKREVLPTSLEPDRDAFMLVANRVTTAKAGPPAEKIP